MSRHILDRPRTEAPALRPFLRIARAQGPDRLARALSRRSGVTVPMLARFLGVRRSRPA